jgi:SulP family sulfate permease
MAASPRADLLAGLTVAIVALPLAIALGVASGASPREGLLTAGIPVFLISALGVSRAQVGGPTGAFVVFAAGLIATRGFSGWVLATAMAAGVILMLEASSNPALRRYSAV